MNAGRKSVEIPLGAHVEIRHGTIFGSFREDVGAYGFSIKGPMWVHLGLHTQDPCGLQPGSCVCIWVFPHGTHVNGGCKSVEIPLGTLIEVSHGTNVGSFREDVGASEFTHMRLIWEARG